MDCDEVRRMLDAYLDGELDLTRQLDVVCPVVPPVKTRLKA
jgi:putative zinc finger protein